MTLCAGVFGTGLKGAELLRFLRDETAGATGWDGHVATTIADQGMTALQIGNVARLCFGVRPDLYA